MVVQKYGGGGGKQDVLWEMYRWRIRIRSLIMFTYSRCSRTVSHLSLSKFAKYSGPLHVQSHAHQKPSIAPSPSLADNSGALGGELLPKVKRESFNKCPLETYSESQACKSSLKDKPRGLALDRRFRSVAATLSPRSVFPLKLKC